MEARIIIVSETCVTKSIMIRHHITIPFRYYDLVLLVFFLFQVLVRYSIKITLSTSKLQPVSILEQAASRSLPDSEDRRDKNWWECASSSFEKHQEPNAKANKNKRIVVAPRLWIDLY
jgi:hypothetical protein